MAYIKGNGYMRFNNRWFGYPKSSGEKVDYAFCAVKHGGRYYFWAPSYDTMHNTIGGWPATGQLIHTFPNYRGSNNDVRIYKIFEDTYKPALFKSSGTVIEQQTGALAIPNATFELTVVPTSYTGNTSIVINDDPANDALVSAYTNLPLIKPKIVTYAIVCDKSGAYNDYRSPLSNQVGETAFKTNFAQHLADWPGAAPLFLELEDGDEATEIQTSFTFPDMGYKLAGQAKVNYQWTNSNPYGLEASLAGGEGKFRALNTMYFTTGSSVPRYETIENGVMLMNATDISPVRKAAHFQCSYKNVDADSSDGTVRIWGYVTAVVGLEYGRMSLND